MACDFGREFGDVLALLGAAAAFVARALNLRRDRVALAPRRFGRGAVALGVELGAPQPFGFRRLFALPRLENRDLALQQRRRLGVGFDAAERLLEFGDALARVVDAALGAANAVRRLPVLWREVPQILVVDRAQQVLLALAALGLAGGGVQRPRQRRVLRELRQVDFEALLDAQRPPQAEIDRLAEDLENPFVRVAPGHRFGVRLPHGEQRLRLLVVALEVGERVVAGFDVDLDLGAGVFVRRA